MFVGSLPAEVWLALSKKFAKAVVSVYPFLYEGIPTPSTKGGGGGGGGEPIPHDFKNGRL